MKATREFCEVFDPLGILSETQIEVTFTGRIMEQKIFNELFEARVEKLREISRTKGVKYSMASGDRLFDFKHEAKETGLTVSQIWYSKFNKHWTAIRHFLNTSENLGDELVENHITDALMFLFLLEGLIADAKTPAPQG